MVMKNWDPFVSLPALAMDRRPSTSCFIWKFSSRGENIQLLSSQSKASGVATFESLAVDGLATGAVVSGEVTTLEHELRDHTVETGTRIAKTMLASCELPKVLCSAWDDAIIQLKLDLARRLTVNGDVKLRCKSRRGTKQYEQG